MGRPSRSTQDLLTSREVALAADITPRNFALLHDQGLAPKARDSISGKAGARVYDGVGLAHAALIGALHLSGLELLVAGRLAAAFADQFDVSYVKLPSNLGAYIHAPLNPRPGYEPWVDEPGEAPIDTDQDYWLHERLRNRSGLYQPATALTGDFIIDIADHSFVTTENKGRETIKVPMTDRSSRIASATVVLEAARLSAALGPGLGVGHAEISKRRSPRRKDVVRVTHLHQRCKIARRARHGVDREEKRLGNLGFKRSQYRPDALVSCPQLQGVQTISREMPVEAARETILEVAGVSGQARRQRLHGDRPAFAQQRGMSRFSLHRRGMELGVSWVGRPEELFPIDRVLVVIDVQLFERLLRIGRQKTEPEPGFVDGAHRSHGLYRHGALG